MSIRCSAVTVAAATLAAALAFAGFGDAAAQAARKEAPRPERQRVLTPEQLQACVSRRDQLREQADSAIRDKAAIDAEKAELDRVTTALGADAAAVDRTSASAVGAYNVRVQQRQRLVEDAQARMVAYNGKAESVRTLQQEYEKNCENRRYDERDLEDLRRMKK